MGDFNINLLHTDTHTPTTDFIEVMNSCSMCPSITKPTRITYKSATLIDNIFTNSHHKHIAGLILTDISDHLPIFISTNLSAYQNEETYSNVDVREINDQNICKFNQKLGSVDWDDVCCSNDVDTTYNCFIDKFNVLYNVVFFSKKK